MNKRIYCILLVLLLVLPLIACNAAESSTSNSKTKAHNAYNYEDVTLSEPYYLTIDGREILCSKGKYYARMFWKEEPSIKNDESVKILDEAQATSVASNLKRKYAESGLLAEHISETEFHEQWLPQAVFYDEADKVWVVEFAPEKDTSNPNVMIMGPSFAVHLRKSNAELLFIGLI